MGNSPSNKVDDKELSRYRNKTRSQIDDQVNT